MSTSPKKSTSQATATDFFARGRKVTTQQRIVNLKKPLSESPVPPSIPPPSRPQNAIIVIDSDDDDHKGNDNQDKKVESKDSEKNPHPPLTGPQKATTNVHEAINKRSASYEPTPLQKEKPKPENPIRRARSVHGVGALFTEIRTQTPRKRSNSALSVGPDVAVAISVLEGIHQEELGTMEKDLRQFDLASKYGPCTDLTRLERWERASLLGLNPPQDIKEALLKNSAWNTPLYAGRV
ncbi:hypothetical protein BGZ94_001303 [Podila epigama]|nr:hypothetical protein BGZ94_001303 [Podila epigama]